MPTDLIRYMTRRNAIKVLIAYILYIVVKYRKTAIGVRPRSDLKGPRGLPILGNVIAMVTRPKNQVVQEYLRFHAIYGKVYAVTLPKVGRIIQICDAEMIDHILGKNFWAYEKGSSMRQRLMPLVGDGIFTADGEHWKWQRKLASNIFTVKAFRQYTSDVFCREGDLAIEYLNKHADTGKPIDLQQLFYCYTLDSFGEIAFGKSFGCMKDPDHEVDFAASFDRLNNQIAGRIYSPIWQLTDWWKGSDKQIEKDSKTVRKFAYDIIEERRRMQANGESISNTKDLLQLFMDMNDNGETLSDSMLVDSVLNFVIAGRDTTAQALSWMFYLLHRKFSNPEIINRLVQETDDILKGGYPTYESTKQQKFNEACFHETLRLYPSVSKNTKLCVQDDVLPGGIKVYKGERIGWSPWVMGRQIDLWGPDAMEFNPDRWFTKDKPHSSKFNAFHHGPRTCLGQQFATIEAISIVSMLLQNFTFELVDPINEPKYLPSLTLPIENGLPVYVKRRGYTATV